MTKKFSPKQKKRASPSNTAYSSNSIYQNSLLTENFTFLVQACRKRAFLV